MSRRAQGGIRNCTKPSITICPAGVAVAVELNPEREQGECQQCGGYTDPEKRRQQTECVADFGNIRVASIVESNETIEPPCSYERDTFFRRYREQ